MKKPPELLIELTDIIKKLREPDGCPWDKKQTPESFKPYLLEETHELSEAIDLGDSKHIKEELGDLFFQLTFLTHLYEEKGLFTMADALQGIIDKMIRRHPHVFTDEKFESEEAIRKNWQKIKAAEKKQQKSDLIDVPKSLPALNRAQRVSSRAASHGFEWPDTKTLLDKFKEIFGQGRGFWIVDQGGQLNPGHAALAGLAVDADHRLVAAAHVLGVDGQVRYLP